MISTTVRPGFGSSGTVDVDTGALLGLKGLVAALAVRFGSPLRAMVAGTTPTASD